MREFVIYFLTGAVLGTVYFYALWISLKLLPKINRKKTFLAATTLFRLAALLTVFYFIITSSRFGIFYTVAGFVAVRMIFIKMKGLKLTAVKSNSLTNIKADS